MCPLVVVDALQIMQNQLNKIEVPPHFLPSRGAFNVAVMASAERRDICM